MKNIINFTLVAVGVVFVIMFAGTVSVSPKFFITFGNNSFLYVVIVATIVAIVTAINSKK